VNAIAPGYFRTPLSEKLLVGTGRGREVIMRTPMNRFGELEDLVGAAIFLASDAASFSSRLSSQLLWAAPKQRPAPVPSQLT
jgi:NAD(P)-dependent dehydrogenase (short-subunit alcohol dehydrogenase family)